MLRGQSSTLAAIQLGRAYHAFPGVQKAIATLRGPALLELTLWRDVWRRTIADHKLHTAYTPVSCPHYGRQLADTGTMAALLILRTASCTVPVPGPRGL